MMKTPDNPLDQIVIRESARLRAEAQQLRRELRETMKHRRRVREDCLAARRSLSAPRP